MRRDDGNWRGGRRGVSPDFWQHPQTLKPENPKTRTPNPEPWSTKKTYLSFSWGLLLEPRRPSRLETRRSQEMDNRVTYSLVWTGVKNESPSTQKQNPRRRLAVGNWEKFGRGERREEGFTSQRGWNQEHRLVGGNKDVRSLLPSSRGIAKGFGTLRTLARACAHICNSPHLSCSDSCCPVSLRPIANIPADRTEIRQSADLRRLFRLKHSVDQKKMLDHQHTRPAPTLSISMGPAATSAW